MCSKVYPKVNTGHDRFFSFFFDIALPVKIFPQSAENFAGFSLFSRTVLFRLVLCNDQCWASEPVTWFCLAISVGPASQSPGSV